MPAKMLALALTTRLAVDVVCVESPIWAKTPSPDALWVLSTPMTPPWVTVIPPVTVSAWIPSLRSGPVITPPAAVVMVIEPAPADLAWMPSLVPVPLTVIEPVMPPLLPPMVMAPSLLSALMPSACVEVIEAVESMDTVPAPGWAVPPPGPGMKSAAPAMPPPVEEVMEALETIVIAASPPPVRPTMPMLSPPAPLDTWMVLLEVIEIAPSSDMTPMPALTGRVSGLSPLPLLVTVIELPVPVVTVVAPVTPPLEVWTKMPAL